MANANFYALAVVLLKSDWNPEKTTIDDSKQDIFTVTQMGLFDNIPPTLKGEGANIAIIDGIGNIRPDGFHIEHQTFSCRPTKQITTTRVANNQTLVDYTFHATKCAGIAIGEPFEGFATMGNTIRPIAYKGGVAPEANAKIFLIDLSDESTFLRALENIEQENCFDVISISLGYPKGDAQGQIKNKLIELSATTLIVVSAGNGGSAKGVLPPANLKEVISVGSLEEFGNPAKSSPTLVDISCYGEVCAPATHAHNNGLIQWATGTSMAAPAIAGLICLIMQCAKHGNYSPSDNKEYVLRQIKEKQNMLRLLKKTVTPDNQVKPAELLKEAFGAENFKVWFDTKMKE